MAPWGGVCCTEQVCGLGSREAGGRGGACGTGAGVLCSNRKAGLWGDLRVIQGRLHTLECVPLKPNRTHLVATAWPPLFLALREPALVEEGWAGPWDAMPVRGWPTLEGQAPCLGAGLLLTETKSRKGPWGLCKGVSPPPSKQLSPEGRGREGPGWCPPPLLCISVVSSSLYLLLPLHPLPLPLGAHRIHHHRSVSYPHTQCIPELSQMRRRGFNTETSEPSSSLSKPVALLPFCFLKRVLKSEQKRMLPCYS